METSTKRKTTGVVTFLFFLCGGIEYAIILPSLWPYLDIYFHSNRAFYGLCFAAFSISGLIFSPVFGYWSDRIKVAKPIILLCNLFEIAGNLVYFASRNQYMVLAGRFLSGIGTGAGAAIFAMLARSSTIEERTRVFAVAMSCRFIGLIVGPGLNAVTSRLNSHQFGPFTFDKYTAPGLIMAGVWLIVEVSMLFFYFDFPTLTDAEAAGLYVPESGDTEYVSNETDPLLGHGKRHPVTSINETSQDHSVQLEASIEERRSGDSSSPPQSWKERMLAFLREEWIVLLACQFILFFNQTALETVIVPLGKDLLGWDILDTSIFYCGCAVEGIACFLALRWISKYVQDRWLLLVGILAELLSLVLFLYYVPTAKPADRRLSYIFMITGSAIGIGALTLFSVATTSLLTKFTSMKYQGTSQGVRRSTGFVATIMGPLWAGAFLSHLTFMLAVEVGLVAMILVMVLLSFSRLRVPKPQDAVVESSSGSTEA
eukprot:scpid69564/ scgid8017/ Major facilitator superfamily domain-containing protein 8